MNKLLDNKIAVMTLVLSILLTGTALAAGKPLIKLADSAYVPISCTDDHGYDRCERA